MLGHRDPRLSVVMPVHNAAPFLDESVQSILGQSFDNFEFVILDDASTDGSLDILHSWARRDPRIRIVASDTALGVARSSETVVRASRSEIVARMDADDVSHHTRLARQMAVLDERPDAVAIGTLFDRIDGAGRRVCSEDRFPLLRASPLKPFPHGTAAFRRSAFEMAGGYDVTLSGCEDADFFYRLTGLGAVLVLPELLYSYRFHSANTLATVTLEAWRAASIKCDAIRQQWPPHPDDPTRTLKPSDQPRVVYAHAAPKLWSGGKPRLLAKMSLRSFFPPTLANLAILAVALCAAVNVRATRFVLRCFIALRDRLARRRVGNAPVQWRIV